MTYHIKLWELVAESFTVMRTERPSDEEPWRVFLDDSPSPHGLTLTHRYEHLPVRTVSVPREGAQGPPHPVFGYSGPYWEEGRWRVAWDPVDRVLYVHHERRRLGQDLDPMPEHTERLRRHRAYTEVATVADRIVGALEGGCWRGRD